MKFVLAGIALAMLCNLGRAAYLHGLLNRKPHRRCAWCQRWLTAGGRHRLPPLLYRWDITHTMCQKCFDTMQPNYKK